MTHNALSRSMENIPMWLVQVLIGIFLTSGVAWATWASVSSWKHEQRIAVVEVKVETVKDDIKEIKDGNKEMNRKLDRLLERRAR
jgi:ubiquinone biosynthesis protein UbiJ